MVAGALSQSAAVDIAGGMDNAAAAPTRDRIKAVAADLYVVRGYAGFSFGDIAQAVGTTRANIHHHFGSKARLMAELVEDFAADASARVHRHWAEDETPFFDRFELQLNDLRRFYTRFNRTDGDRNIWSPVSRLRLDMPSLGEVAGQALAQVSQVYDTSLRQSLAKGIEANELRPDTPIGDVARILRVTLMSCGPVTQDSGSFAEVERLIAALRQTVAAAWAKR